MTMLAQRQQLTVIDDRPTLPWESWGMGSDDVPEPIRREHDRVIETIGKHVNSALLEHLKPIHEDIGFIKGTLKAYGERLSSISGEDNKTSFIRIASRVVNSRGFLALVIGGTLVTLATIIMNHETISSIWKAAGGH